MAGVGTAAHGPARRVLSGAVGFVAVIYAMVRSAADAVRLGCLRVGAWSESRWMILSVPILYRFMRFTGIDAPYPARDVGFAWRHGRGWYIYGITPLS